MKKLLFLFCIFLLGIMLFQAQNFSLFADSTDITSADFAIKVGDITPGSTTLIGDDAGETVDNFLMTILEKIIVVFGVCAAFIMTIGGGYMIIYHGQDEFLSKGKSIFLSGLIALFVALSAGVIVRLFAFLLYQ